MQNEDVRRVYEKRKLRNPVLIHGSGRPAIKDPTFGIWSANLQHRENPRRRFLVLAFVQSVMVLSIQSSPDVLGTIGAASASI